MLAKAAAALAAIVIPLSVCTIAAPTASAVPEPQTTPALVAICLNIPLGSVSISFCL
ncbi:hypothetical protein [Nocardia lijiangensis]|uniref:hypothetical protein n=1 Tax=Nocardia lijiangensis TaxID=299618 RepID=UPI000A7CE679|nr:hypothetical protein [Nocardia lijiangensis]